MSLLFDLSCAGGRVRAQGLIPGRGITVLMGESGAGKTSLLRALTGLDREATGEIRLRDDRWLGRGLNVPVHRRRIGMVFQQAALLPGRTVAGNLDFALARSRAPLLSRDKAIEATGIGSLLPQSVESLSGGERQRVALARALVTDARLLLLDEPLAALDQSARQRLLAILQRLAGEIAIPVIYVTHSLEEAGLLADQLLYLCDGHIAAAGPARQLLTDVEGPFVAHSHALTPIAASIRRHDDRDCLTELDWGTESLWVPRLAGLPGDPVRLLLHARDISLSLETPAESSILNLVNARVDAWRDLNNGQCAVRLDTPMGPLLARVTRRSSRLLGLHAGQAVKAMIKSVALPAPAAID